VRQILLNVLGNAVKFTTSGTVTLAAHDDGRFVCVTVQDTGPGIPDVDQARIFESFFQSQAALDRTPGPREGVGLGLAITKLLTEQHGGSLELRSILGTGTTITIRLPRSSDAQRGEGASS
jgi:signal transduction histidine kinase